MPDIVGHAGWNRHGREGADPSPMKLDDKLGEWLLWLKNKDERSWVRHDYPWIRGMVARAVVVFVVGVAADFYLQWADYGPLYSLASIFIGAIVGRVAYTTIARAQAYRNGWLEGRGQMMISLTEAVRRDMSPQEWIESQMEADLAMVGRNVVFSNTLPRGHRLGGCEECAAELQAYIDGGGDLTQLGRVYHFAPPYEEFEEDV